MRPFRNLAILAVFLFSFTLPACSKSNDSQKESKETKPVTEQAKEAIQDYGNKPIERAGRPSAWGRKNEKYRPGR